MPAPRHSLRLLPLLLLPALLTLTGCDLGGPDGELPQNFSLQFVNGDRVNEEWWVVLQTRAGDSALAVQRVPSSGLVDFGDIHGTRLSCTLIRRYGLNHIEFESFLDVPAGDWREEWPEPDMMYNDGLMDVTLSFPAGQYSADLLWMPNNSEEDYTVPSDGWSVFTPEYFGLDHDRFTAFGQAQSFGQGFCGELLGAPYSSSHMNHYTLELDRAMSWQSLETTRPCTDFELAAYRDDVFFPPVPLRGWRFEDGQHWQLPFCDFSADGYDLYVANNDPTANWSYMRRSAGLPSTLEIPTSTVSGAYNGYLGRFENVRVHGTADFTEAMWMANLEATAGYWWVLAGASTRTIVRPALPDSLLAAFDLSLDDFSGVSLSGYDYSDIGSFDGEINRRFKSEPSLIPHYDRKFAYHTFFNDYNPLTAASVSSRPASPNRLR